MCEDKRQSKSSEIARRMGKKTNEVSSIRAKLLQREVIQAPQRGYVQFAVPDLDI
jgi:Mn-dependent DtxR family transcriptional regulator